MERSVAGYWTEVGRVGFHCVEISYARTTCKTETGNVEENFDGELHY